MRTPTHGASGTADAGAERGTGGPAESETGRAACELPHPVGRESRDFDQAILNAPNFDDDGMAPFRKMRKSGQR